jgi:putative hydrolase of the HAD superfamily
MRFDAVAFDLDGTLYPSYRLYARAFPRMLGEARIFEAFNETRSRLRALGAEGALRREFGSSGAAAGDAFRVMEAELMAKRLGIGVAEAAMMIDRDFYRGVEELFSRIRPFRGIKSTLDAIAGSGLRIALLSDLPPARKLELLGLSGSFEFALCSEDIGFLKPAKEPFAELASRLGLEPERILYVGNSPSIDVAGAKAAGMSAAIVSFRRVAGADLSFFDWRRLTEFAVS